MGLIDKLVALVFGNGRNAIAETAEVFRENAEAGAVRAGEVQRAAMQQFAAEFAQGSRSRFDLIMDGINRLPRPALALGTLGLFVAAMVDPLWFAARMQGLTLVPEPLWWLLGVVVSFYFGARYQTKSQEFQRDLAAAMARAPRAMENLSALRDLQAATPGVADPGPDAELALTVSRPDTNPALEHWRRRRGG